MGCSLYFAATGTHPILPVDIVEANYLLPPPDTMLTTTGLITQRAIMLQKQRDQLANLQDSVYGAQLKAAIKFKEDHANTIHNFDFKTRRPCTGMEHHNRKGS